MARILTLRVYLQPAVDLLNRIDAPARGSNLRRSEGRRASAFFLAWPLAVLDGRQHVRVSADTDPAI